MGLSFEAFFILAAGLKRTMTALSKRWGGAAHEGGMPSVKTLEMRRELISHRPTQTYTDKYLKKFLAGMMMCIESYSKLKP